MYGENAPPSWARLPGARCRAVEHLTKLDGLKEFELFEGLEEGFFQDLAIAAEVLELGADTALYREGEPSGAVYFVGEGRVKLYRTSGGPKARDQILGVVGDGSVLGLGAAIEGRTQGHGAYRLRALRCLPRRPVRDHGPLPRRRRQALQGAGSEDPRAGRPRRRPSLPQRPTEGGKNAAEP